MAISTSNIGTRSNDGTGDDLREAFVKVNNNFTELDARQAENTTASNRLADDGTTKGVFAEKSNDNLAPVTEVSKSNYSVIQKNPLFKSAQKSRENWRKKDEKSSKIKNVLKKH